MKCKTKKYLKLEVKILPLISLKNHVVYSQYTLFLKDIETKCFLSLLEDFLMKVHNLSFSDHDLLFSGMNLTLTINLMKICWRIINLIFFQNILSHHFERKTMF